MKNHLLRSAFCGLVLFLLAAAPIHARRIVSHHHSKHASTAVTSTPDAVKSPAFIITQTQFLNALWSINPDAAIAAGKFDGAGVLIVPDAQSRQATVAFADKWLQRLGQYDPSRLTVNQGTDLALMKNYLQSMRWYIADFKDFEWDPTQYNIAGNLDVILTTEYAPQAQRLRAILQRLEKVPSYYLAARNSIHNPTIEHTQLAISQSAGALSVLDDIDKISKLAALNPDEKQLFTTRLDMARSAVNAYIAWLTNLNATRDPASARSFRIGKKLYDAKFEMDIQSSFSAEQTYQNALAFKDDLHEKMNALADTLWPTIMKDQVKPEDRLSKIGMVINELAKNHIQRENILQEVRRQIPLLEDWIVQHDLLNIDRSKPLIVRETPPYQRGVTVASIDAPGPYQAAGNTYYNVSPLDALTAEQAESLLREYNYWTLQILTIHEAVPGHYIQLLHANKSPSIVKALFGNGAMIEGWAVYSERMMMESGYGGNAPEMWLMYYKWNLRTVCNTILDYRTHVLGMTQEQAMDLLVRQSFQTESEARGKWQRVQYSSVQLASYFSGFSDIMALREQQKKQLGEQFNLKKFHEDFLSYGSAPVRMIKDSMQTVPAQ